MVDTCTCTNDSSSRKQGFQSLSIHSFPKKLLVAVTVVVIISMCLRPADAAAIERRHKPHDNMSKETKEIGARHPFVRRRHQMRNGAQTKDNTKKQNDPFEKARSKIENKMAYMRDNFADRRKNLTEQWDYGTGMPVWLPKTNFVDIHFHKFGFAHKSEAFKSKRIFEFIMRKLFKSLLEYHEIFKRFKMVEVVSPDTQITSYNIKRQDIFTRTTDDLYSSIEDIKDIMIRVKMTKWPKVNAKKMKLDSIELNVDAAKYLKNDDILLRAYGNLLNNWHLELNCSRVRRPRNSKVPQHVCSQYEERLKKKRESRLRNKRKKLQENS